MKLTKKQKAERLLNSPKFAKYIRTVRKDFLANPEKYPKMKEEDWEDEGLVVISKWVPYEID